MTKVAKSSNRGSKPGEHRGGRKKGTPNKNTQAARDMMDAMGFNPIEATIRLGQEAEENGDPHLAFSCYAKVMPFFAPTLKNIEFKGEIDTHNVSNITVDVNVHDVG